MAINEMLIWIISTTYVHHKVFTVKLIYRHTQKKKD